MVLETIRNLFFSIRIKGPASGKECGVKLITSPTVLKKESDNNLLTRPLPSSGTLAGSQGYG